MEIYCHHHHHLSLTHTHRHTHKLLLMKSLMFFKFPISKITLNILILPWLTAYSFVSAPPSHDFSDISLHCSVQSFLNIPSLSTLLHL